jgi:hypothetical protein
MFVVINVEINKIWYNIWFLIEYFNHLKLMLLFIIFKNSARTSERTQHFTIPKIEWLMLFKEVIAVWNEKHKKPMNTKCRVTDY